MIPKVGPGAALFVVLIKQFLTVLNDPFCVVVVVVKLVADVANAM